MRAPLFLMIVTSNSLHAHNNAVLRCPTERHDFAKMERCRAKRSVRLPVYEKLTTKGRDLGLICRVIAAEYGADDSRLKTLARRRFARKHHALRSDGKNQRP